MPVPSGSAEDWLGERHFRCLGYTFGLSWDSQAVGRDIRRILGRFEIPYDRVATRTPPTPNVPPVYSLSQSPHDWVLRYGHDVLFGPEPYDEVLCHLLWHINAEVTRFTGSYLLIHAGTIASPAGEAMILAGDSGAGKTTLVAGMVQKGFAYLSDEAAAIDPVAREVYPYPKALTLKRGSFSLFPELDASDLAGAVRLAEQWFVPAEAFGGRSAAGSCLARWIVSVRYERGSPTRLESITSGTAVLDLVPRIMNMPHYGPRAIPLLADLVRGAKSYRLVTGDLGEAVGTLYRLALGGDDEPEHERASVL